MEALVAYYRKYEAAVPDFTRGRDARRRASSRARSSRAARPTRRRRTCRCRRLLAAGRPGTDAAADVHHARARARCSTRRACATRPTRCSRTGSTAAFASSAATRRTSRTARRPAATTLQGRRPRPRHADVRPDQGAALRRRHRSAAGRLRAGRVVVRDDGARRSRAQQDDQDERGRATGCSWWQRGGFDHVERHDDRVQLFATRSSEGRHEFSYVVRATTAGTFRTAPARAEEMYEPEVFGRTATAVIEVKRSEARCDRAGARAGRCARPCCIGG